MLPRSRPRRDESPVASAAVCLEGEPACLAALAGRTAGTESGRMRAMSRLVLIVVALSSCLAILAAGRSSLQVAPETPPPPPYLNPDLDVEARAADLVSRMTLEEKISQLTNDARAIPRLGVPAYDWWNECLHGVARGGRGDRRSPGHRAAATFDAPLDARGGDGRSATRPAPSTTSSCARGQPRRYQGLTFWSPNINIFRDPRWGRGQETYGEDPYLTARMGVAFVTGLQGDDPRYHKVVATAKHFAVHSGPEPERHHFDARPTERDLHETYLPAFRALVRGGQGRVGDGGLQPRQRRVGLGQPPAAAATSCAASGASTATSSPTAAPSGTSTGRAQDRGDAGGSGGPGLTRRLRPELRPDVRAARSRARAGAAEREGRRRRRPPADAGASEARACSIRPSACPTRRSPTAMNESPEHGACPARGPRVPRPAEERRAAAPRAGISERSRSSGPTADEVAALLGNYYGTPAAPVTVLDGIRNAVSPAHEGDLRARGGPRRGPSRAPGRPRDRGGLPAAGRGLGGAGLRARILPGPRSRGRRRS